MPFKINIADKGKTLKVESESESLIGKKIGETIQGSDISEDLTGYEIEITGTADDAGFPGFKGHEGSALKRVLLTKKDKGMNDSRNGIRLRKTIRGEEIGEKTTQINTIVKKEGAKKFADLLPKKEEVKKEGEEKPTEEAAPTEAPNETPAEKPAEESKPEEKPAEEAK